MKLEILPSAEGDLVDRFWFYEKQGTGLGSYFRESLIGDIESLRSCGGVHREGCLAGTACSRGVFRMRSIIRFTSGRFGFGLCSTAVAIRRGRGARYDDQPNSQ